MSWFRNRRDSWQAQRAAASWADSFKVRGLPDDGTVVVAVKDQETGRWAEVEFGTGDIYLVLAMLRTARARARRRFVSLR